jgi:hypothetical protein
MKYCPKCNREFTFLQTFIIPYTGVGMYEINKLAFKYLKENKI